MSQGRIVFSSGSSGDNDIFVLDSEDGSLEQLTTGSVNNDQPRWSPARDKIVYVSNSSGTAELWLMGPRGEDKRQLTSLGKFHQSPVWLPDGKSVICAANYEDADQIELWKISLADPDHPERVLAAPGLERDLSISPDGSTLMFSSGRGGNFNFWRYSLMDKKLTQFTNSPGKEFSPVFSPDGSQIAYFSCDAYEEDGGSFDADILLVPLKAAAGNAPRRLAHVRGADFHLTWSPDGTKLAFCASPQVHNAGRLQVLDVASGKIEKLHYDRTLIEKELKSEIKDFGILSRLTPDVIQRAFVSPAYFGSERFPDWR